MALPLFMNSSRRKFSQWSALTLHSSNARARLAAICGSAFAPLPSKAEGLDQNQEWLIGGGQFVHPSAPNLQRKAISLMSLTGRAPKLIDVGFFPHGFAIDPSNPKRVASFQKIGPGAALVDLSTSQVLETISKRGDQQFYGHGAFTLDGKLLLSTERDEQAKRGLIAVRDGKTMAYLGEFPSYGDSPHDCHLIENGQTLVVANGDGSLAYIDLKSQKLLEKLTIPNRGFNAGHLQALAHRKVIVVSAPAKGLGEHELGGISVRLSGAPWASISQPAELVSKMTGEALSVAVSQKHGVFGVTHPSANLITFWSVSDGKALANLAIPRPRGIEVSADGAKFLLSFGQHAGLAIVDAKSLTVLEQSSDTAYFSGSHIVNWSRLTQARG